MTRTFDIVFVFVSKFATAREWPFESSCQLKTTMEPSGENDGIFAYWTFQPLSVMGAPVRASSSIDGFGPIIAGTLPGASGKIGFTVESLGLPMVSTFVPSGYTAPSPISPVELCRSVVVVHGWVGVRIVPPPQ